MNKKVLEQIAGALKFDAELLAKSLSSENEDEKIELPKLFTESQVETIKENVGKEKYDAGAIASRDMTLKDLSDLAGFDERVKDKEAFISRFKDSILKDASIEPNKKVKELEQSLEKLQNTVLERDKAISDLENDFKQKETKIKAQSLIPDFSKTLGITKEEATSLFFMRHDIKDDGIYRDGEKLKDDYEKPLDLQSVINNFVSEKGWDKELNPIGRGGGSGHPRGGNGKPSNLAEFEKYVSEKGLNIGSAEANALLKELATENPEILN